MGKPGQILVTGAAFVLNKTELATIVLTVGSQQDGGQDKN
jgi:hypothetical protein